MLWSATPKLDDNVQLWPSNDKAGSFDGDDRHLLFGDKTVSWHPLSWLWIVKFPQCSPQISRLPAVHSGPWLMSNKRQAGPWSVSPSCHRLAASFLSWTILDNRLPVRPLALLANGFPKVVLFPVRSEALFGKQPLERHLVGLSFLLPLYIFLLSSSI